MSTTVRPGLSAGLIQLLLTLFAGVVVLLTIALVVMGFRLRSARAAGEANALRADSTAAVLDTTRRVLLSERDRVRLLGDSAQALERRVVQLSAVTPDDFDRATRRTSVVRGGIAVTPGRVVTEASGASSVAAGDVREAVFHVDSSSAGATARFVADVAVRVPPPPVAATLRLDVALSPIVLRPRVQCGAPDAGGVRPASIAVIAPAGVTLDVLASEIDVRACNPEFGRPTGVRVPLGVAVSGALVAALTAVLLTR